MAHVTRRHTPHTVKVFTLLDGQIFSLIDPGASHLVLMTMPSNGRRENDRYTESVQAVDLITGRGLTVHGSARVVHHKNAAVVLDYTDE